MVGLQSICLSFILPYPRAEVISWLGPTFYKLKCAEDAHFDWMVPSALTFPWLRHLATTPMARMINLSGSGVRFCRLDGWSRCHSGETSAERSLFLEFRVAPRSNLARGIQPGKDVQTA